MNKLQLLSAVTLSILSVNAVENHLNDDSLCDGFVIISTDTCSPTGLEIEGGSSTGINLENLTTQRLKKEASLIEKVTGRAYKKPKPSLATVCYVENYLSEEACIKEMETVAASPMKQMHEGYDCQVDGCFSKKGSDQTNDPHPINDSPLTEPLKQSNRTGLSNLIAQLFYFGGEHHSAATQRTKVEPSAKHLQSEIDQQSKVASQPEGPHELSSLMMSSSILEAVIPQEYPQDLSSSIRASSLMEASQLLQVTQPEQSQDLSSSMMATSISVETIQPLQTAQSPLIKEESEPTTAQQLHFIVETTIEAQPQVAVQQFSGTITQPQAIPSTNESVPQVQPQAIQQLQVTPLEVSPRSTSTSSHRITQQLHPQATSPRAVSSQASASAIHQARMETSRAGSQPTSTSSQVTTQQPRPQAISPRGVSSQASASATQQSRVETSRAGSQPTLTSSQVTTQQPRPQATSPRGVSSQASASAIQQSRVETSRAGSQSTSTSSQVTTQQPRPQATSPRRVVKQPISTAPHLQRSTRQASSQSHELTSTNTVRPPLCILQVKPIRIIAISPTSLGDTPPYAVKVPQ